MHMVEERRLSVGVIDARPEQAVNLLAGQLYFGHRPRSVRTLLGSCVAITLWHPTRRIGGMCHFLLPSRRRRASDPLDARFGDEAVSLLAAAIDRAGTRCQDYEAQLYGGADTLPDGANVKFDVGERNIAMAWELIDRHGFSLSNVDVGDRVPRTVELDFRTGAVTMRRGRVIGEQRA
jgi:chemotaxis protein CheD